MNRPTKQLLDDLAEDLASPEFRAGLMDKTLSSARLRKRLRSFHLALNATAVAGICAFAFYEMREPVLGVNQARPPISNAKPAPLLNALRVVSTKPDSTLTMVQTSESAGPREINDKELLTLLAGKSVALVRRASNQTELVSFDPNK